MNLIQKFSTTRGFISRYMHHLTQCETQQQAYEATESEYSAIFNRRKYSNYNSFRNVKIRLIRHDSIK
jgi:hypothetical protein